MAIILQKLKCMFGLHSWIKLPYWPNKQHKLTFCKHCGKEKSMKLLLEYLQIIAVTLICLVAYYNLTIDLQTIKNGQLITMVAQEQIKYWNKQQIILCTSPDNYKGK